MPGPPRRRVDFTRLPAPAQYALALVILAVVVTLAVTAPGSHSASEPADWYTVVVRVGAVLLLLYTGFRLARRLLRIRQQRASKSGK
jgi:Kef-type K+ transport system membrane component KefB